MLTWSWVGGVVVVGVRVERFLGVRGFSCVLCLWFCKGCGRLV